MKLYVIKDWAENYESADNRRTEGPLRWYMARVRMDSIGFARMTQEKDAAQLFGAWHLLLMIAANQDKDERGKIARNGTPLTCEDLEIMTRFPAKIFERALEFFASERISWITALCCESTDKSVNPQQSAGTSQQNAVYSTVDNSTVDNSTVDNNTDMGSLAAVSGTSEDHANASKARAARLLNKRPTTAWDASELKAWKLAKGAVESTSEADWQLLEWFYGLPQDETFARKSLAVLLNNWNGEISKAVAHRAKHGEGSKQGLFR